MKVRVEYVDIDSLIPYVNNPRQHPKEQVDMIAASIREFGFLNPIIITKDNEVIAGHGRLLACQKLGIREVPVIRAEHLTPAQIKAYRLADNRLTELGGWDIDLIKVELKELQDLSFDITLTGFKLQELEELLTKEMDSAELKYNPVLEPKIEDREVTEEDIQKVDLSVDQRERGKEVICPFCFKKFYVEE